MLYARADHAPDPGKLSALALALSQGQRQAAWAFVAAQPAGRREELLRLAVQAARPRGQPRQRTRAARAGEAPARSRRCPCREVETRARRAEHRRSARASATGPCSNFSTRPASAGREMVRLGRLRPNREKRLLRIRQGKGRKDRVVPVGPRALRWVEKYLEDVRPLLVVGADRAGAVPHRLRRGVQRRRARPQGHRVHRQGRASAAEAGRIFCATRAPRTCSKAAPTSASSSSCSGTRSWKPPRSTPKSTSSSCRPFTPVATRGAPQL